MKSLKLSAVSAIAAIASAAALLGCAAPSSPSDGASPGPPGLGEAMASAVEVCMPTGERAYLARLQCADGSTPANRRVGSFGMRSQPPKDMSKAQEAALLDQLVKRTPLKPGEPDHHIIDGYELSCGPVKRMVYMDMYHCNQAAPVEAPRGFQMRSPA